MSKENPITNIDLLYYWCNATNNAEETTVKELGKFIQSETNLSWDDVKSHLTSEFGINVQDEVVSFDNQPMAHNSLILTLDGVIAGNNIVVKDNKDGTITIDSNGSSTTQIQTDWNQIDNTKLDFIKNKPLHLVSDENYIHTDNNFNNDDKTKINDLKSMSNVDDALSDDKEYCRKNKAWIEVTSGIGEKGDKGDRGIQGIQGEKGLDAVNQNLNSVMKNGNIAGTNLDMNMFEIDNLKNIHFMEDDLEKECLVDFQDGKLIISFTPALVNSVISNKGFEGSINDVTISNTLSEDVFLNGKGEYKSIEGGVSTIWNTGQPRKQGDEVADALYVQYKDGADPRAIKQGDILSIWKYNVSLDVQNWQEYPIHVAGLSEVLFSNNTMNVQDGMSVIVDGGDLHVNIQDIQISSDTSDFPVNEGSTWNFEVATSKPTTSCSLIYEVNNMLFSNYLKFTFDSELSSFQTMGYSLTSKITLINGTSKILKSNIDGNSLICNLRDYDVTSIKYIQLTISKTDITTVFTPNLTLLTTIKNDIIETLIVLDNNNKPVFNENMLIDNSIGDKYLSETARIRNIDNKIIFEIYTGKGWVQAGEMGI